MDWNWAKLRPECSALTIVEKTDPPDPTDKEALTATYALRYLERFPISTSYQNIFQHLEELLANPILAKAPIALDQTGVGEVVVELFRKGGG